jgi:hypothetical protein
MPKHSIDTQANSDMQVKGNREVLIHEGSTAVSMPVDKER